MTTRQIRGGALSAVGLVCALAVSASVVRAQSALPTGWASREVGRTGIDGSATVSSGTWTVAGSGANIWGTSDEFRFAYQQITGDVDIRVRLASFEDVNAYSKAGVMIRETLNGNSRNAYLMLIPGSGLFMQSRPSPGAATARLSGRAGAVPLWLRLVRQGNQFSSYYSIPRTERRGRRPVRRQSTWPPQSMSALRYEPLRLAALDSDVHQSSGQRGAGSASGSDRSASDRHHHAPRAMDQPRRRQPQPCWLVVGSWWHLHRSGGRRNIWGTSDEFHFVYQPMQGDVEVIARVASLQPLIRGRRQAS